MPASITSPCWWGSSTRNSSPAARWRWAGPLWVLSFFTFQQLWLLKEVCTGEYVPGPGDRLLLYGLFFPTVTSGPILRPDTFFPQLRGETFLHPDWSDAAAGVYAICCGTIKKVLLADSFGTVVNNGWTRLGS